MIRVGITGQNGFIGRYLYNTLSLLPAEFKLVEFNRHFFDRQELLDTFVSSCDAIVHLAGLNRHAEQEKVYDTNLLLAERLINSLNRVGKPIHIIFSSSTQEERDNAYGKSKKLAREYFSRWAKAKTYFDFTGMMIPNVFGPFGQPHYNSVVATFCYQLTNGEMPCIDVDGEIGLIYVGDLVNIIIDVIRGKSINEDYKVLPSQRIRVSALLDLLSRYKSEYINKGIIPSLSSRFELDLFNTFRSFIPLKDYFPVRFAKHADDRGSFVEIIRLNEGGQVSFSTTKPGVTRGNHFHTRKIERFAVIKGQALIQMRKIDTTEVIDFFLNGDDPAYVDMPIWYTHNIKNIGEEELYTIFWINEFFDPSDSDTYFVTV